MVWFKKKKRGQNLKGGKKRKIDGAQSDTDPKTPPKKKSKHFVTQRGKKNAPQKHRSREVGSHPTARTSTILQNLASTEGAEKVLEVHGGEKTYRKFVDNSKNCVFVKGRCAVKQVTSSKVQDPIILPSFNSPMFAQTGCGPCRLDKAFEKRTIVCKGCKRTFHAQCLKTFGLEEPLSECNRCNS